MAMSPRELQAQMGAHLASVPGAVGVTNHMGSRMTEDRPRMRSVLEVMAGRRLFLVDGSPELLRDPLLAELLIDRCHHGGDVAAEVLELALERGRRPMAGMHDRVAREAVEQSGSPVRPVRSARPPDDSSIVSRTRCRSTSSSSGRRARVRTPRAQTAPARRPSPGARGNSAARAAGSRHRGTA